MNSTDYLEGQPIVDQDGSIRHGYVTYEPWPSLKIYGEGSIFLTNAIISAGPHDKLWPATRLIPERVRLAVKMVPAHQWALLRMCAHWTQDGIILVERCPALALLLCEKESFNYPNYFTTRPTGRWLDLCGNVGLPRTKAALNILLKLRPEQCHMATIRCVAEMLKSRNPWLKTLSHLCSITRDTVAVLRLPADMISAKLLMNTVGTPPDEERVAWIVGAVRYLHAEFSPGKPWPYLNCNLTELSRIERTIMTKHDTRFKIKILFPYPPISGIPGQIEPIINSEMLFDEGGKQDNCSANFFEDIQQGNCYIYRLLAPERATVRIVRESESDPWRLIEAHSKSNESISATTEAYLRNWFNTKYNQEEQS
jgi:hypothetical protein